MTTAETLNELADRVEREEPGRELDAAVLIACGHQAVNRGQRMGWEYRPNRVGIWRSMPSPTTSLDAAVTLVPKDCGWQVSVNEHRCEVVIVHPSRFREVGRAITKHPRPAAALTAAALRARAALLTDGADSATGKGQDPQ